jgi:hypothetical protein
MHETQKSGMLANTIPPILSPLLCFFMQIQNFQQFHEVERREAERRKAVHYEVSIRITRYIVNLSIEPVTSIANLADNCACVRRIWYLTETDVTIYYEKLESTNDPLCHKVVVDVCYLKAGRQFLKER